jgi:hypothetical protein
MVEVMLDGADDDLERALSELVEAEAAWASQERSRLMMPRPLVPALKTLVAANRWQTVLRVSRAFASAKHTIVGGKAELAELLKLAPREFSSQINALGMGELSSS